MGLKLPPTHPRNQNTTGCSTLKLTKEFDYFSTRCRFRSWNLPLTKKNVFLKESKIRKIRKKLFVEDNWLFVREQKFACYETSCDSENFYFTCLFSFENLTERGWNEVVSVAQVCKCNRCTLKLFDEQALGKPGTVAMCCKPSSGAGVV